MNGSRGRGMAMVLALTGALLSSAAACGGEAKVTAPSAAEAADSAALSATLDQETRAAATAILRAIGARDLQALSAYATVGGRTYLDKVVPGHPAWERIFGDDSWRYQAALAWDGELKAVRAEGQNTAWVWFADVTTGDGETEKAVVALAREGDRWTLQDLKTPTEERWSKFGEAAGGGGGGH